MYPYKDTDNIKSNIFSPLGLTVESVTEESVLFYTFVPQIVNTRLNY